MDIEAATSFHFFIRNLRYFYDIKDISLEKKNESFLKVHQINLLHNTLLQIVNKHLRDQHNSAKTQLMTVTNEREQLLDSFKTLKENCDNVEKRCRELKEKRNN